MILDFESDEGALGELVFVAGGGALEGGGDADAAA